MFKRTITPTRISDRLSYLWLALGAALLLFSYGQWIIPLAAWLAPLFLLRFVRTTAAALWTAAGLAREVGYRCQFAQQGIVIFRTSGYYAIIVLMSLVTLLPYLADRLLTPRLQGFVATLVFPVTFTMFEYLSSFSPFGTLNSIANTQYGNLPLLQLVSVTGIWGITFLITWFAAVGNWAWERGFAWPRVRGGTLLYATVLASGTIGRRRTAGVLPAGRHPGSHRGAECIADGGRHVQPATVVCDPELADLGQGHAGGPRPRPFRLHYARQ